MQCTIKCRKEQYHPKTILFTPKEGGILYGIMGIRRTAEKGAARMGTPAFLSVLVLTGIVIIIGAIFIGKSDEGQIDVSATIRNSNQANIDANGDPNNNIGTVSDALRNMPNGGLVPQENQENNTPPVAVEESSVETSTTTEDTASTSPEDATSEDTQNGEQ